MSSRDAFLNPMRESKNLIIKKFAQVIKVIINGEKVAMGVEYEQFGEIKQAFAGKEVILSAGAVESPKILLLSGIGPLADLNHLNVCAEFLIFPYLSYFMPNYC